MNIVALCAYTDKAPKCMQLLDFFDASAISSFLYEECDLNLIPQNDCDVN